MGVLLQITTLLYFAEWSTNDPVIVTTQSVSAVDTDPWREVSGFFLLLTALTVVFYLLSAIFLVYQPPKTDSAQNEGLLKQTQTDDTKSTPLEQMENIEGSEKTVKDKASNNADKDTERHERQLLLSKNTDSMPNDKPNESTEGSQSIPQDLYGLTLLKNVDFNLIVWPNIFLGAVHIGYVYNLSAMIESFGLERHIVMLLLVNFLSVALTRIPVFFIIDRVSAKRILMILAGVTQVLAIILCFIFYDSVVVFTLCIVLNAFVSSCTWTASSALLAELCGPKYFGYNFGWMNFGFGLLAVLLQSLSGVFYDMNIDTSVTRHCFGRQCFQMTMLVWLAFSVVSMSLSGLHFWRGRKR